MLIAKAESESIELLLDEIGHLTNRDIDKGETFIPSSPLSSTPVVGPGNPRVLC